MADEIMDSEKIDYHSYLLRLWRVKADGDSWRASLQEVQSGEVWGFTSPGELFSYLEDLLGQAEGILQQAEHEAADG